VVKFRAQKMKMERWSGSVKVMMKILVFHLNIMWRRLESIKQEHDMTSCVLRSA
jgi:hypothetical protein